MSALKSIGNDARSSGLLFMTLPNSRGWSERSFHRRSAYALLVCEEYLHAGC